MNNSYDVIVIGGGPAGYVAAIRCAQLGLNTACVDQFTGADKKPALGGTCLNVGCIPSKALLDSSEQFHKLNHQFSLHGIHADNARINVSEMIARKNKIVHSLTSGIATLFKGNGIDSIFGHGRLLADKKAGKKVTVSNPHTGEVTQTISAQNIILATGSEVTPLPGVPFDNEFIVDSAGALNFDHVPRRLGVIGAGVIGLELGSVWRRLGSEVSILEAMDTFLPTADKNVARDAQRQFKQQGLNIRLNAQVSAAALGPGGIDVRYAQAGKQETLEVDRLIVAIGRRPYTKNLLEPGSAITLDQRGFINTDQHLQSNEAGVYAIGDCINGPMLAHRGSEDGIAVAEHIANGGGHINYDNVPWVIYTAPEIAWVGKTEQTLRAEGVPIKSGMFPFAATGRAKAMEETGGMVKIIAHAETDRILGVHMIGPHVSELISEAVVAMEFHASAEDIARIVHAHPTLSEAVHEAALAVDKAAIHKVN